MGLPPINDIGVVQVELMWEMLGHEREPRANRGKNTRPGDSIGINVFMVGQPEPVAIERLP